MAMHFDHGSRGKKVSWDQGNSSSNLITKKYFFDKLVTKKILPRKVMKLPTTVHKRALC